MRVSEAGWSDTQALLGFSTAAALLAGFTLVESRAGQPIMPLRLFSDRDRAGGHLGVLLLTGMGCSSPRPPGCGGCGPATATRTAC
ncbi:hypothetical protein [Streptomyces sp. NPDC050534]|uniref:hypothetical protein n=1 Tax=Streptomyces sp. NPDC050534 TaxID=3365625 RepID=UPI0037A45A7C